MFPTINLSSFFLELTSLLVLNSPTGSNKPTATDLRQQGKAKSDMAQSHHEASQTEAANAAHASNPVDKELSSQLSALHGDQAKDLDKQSLNHFIGANKLDRSTA
jgi:hypothetical protein